MLSRRRKAVRARMRYARLLAERLEDRLLLAQVGYQVHLLPPDGNLAGTELTSVSVGQSYDLVVSVRDLRENPGPTAGVFAGYVDIGYDSAKTRVQVGEVQRIRVGPFSPDNPASSASGTFTLVSNGHTTWPISYTGDVHALAVAAETAIGALSGVGLGNVSVKADIINSGTSEVVLQVRFLNKFFDQNVANLLVGSQNLTGPTNPQVSLTYEGDLGSGAGFAFTESFRSRLGTPAFTNGVSAGNQPNLLDDVGAFAGFVPTGSGLQELVRARMVATAAGTVTFTPGIASRILPAHHTLLFDPISPVESNEIDLGTPKALTISTAPLVAVPDFYGTVTNAFFPVVLEVLNNDITTPTVGQSKGLVSVTQPPLGTTALNGNRIHYTPAPGFTGTETFSYTARNTSAGAGSETATASVTVTVLPATQPLVRYQVHLVGAGGALYMPDPQNSKTLIAAPETSSIRVGDEYDMVVTVQPTSMTPLGVFAAYTDIPFDGTKTRPQTPEFQFLSVGPFTLANPASSASGTFRLKFGELTTEPVTYSSSINTLAASVANALAALPGVGAGQIRVLPSSGTPAGTWLKIIFEGKYTGIDVPNLTVEAAALTGPTNPQVTMSYEGDLQGGATPDMGVMYAFMNNVARDITNVAEATRAFVDAPAASLLPNRLNDVGGAHFSGPSSSEPTSAELAAGYTIAPPRVLARLRFKGTSEGTVTFQPDVSQIQLPTHATLLTGVSAEIGAALISTGTPKSLVIANPQPYVAAADSAALLEDSAGVTIDVLSNDTAPAPSTTKQLVSFTQPASGTVTQEGQSLRYVPPANFYGTATFTYTAKGNALTESGLFGTATVTVTVEAVNDAPTMDAFPGPIVLLEDAPEQTITITGISAGGGENQRITETIDPKDAALIGGLLEFFPETNSATYTFRPRENVTGAATFVVVLSDDGGTANGGVDVTRQTIAVLINSVNDAPTFAVGPDQQATDESGPQTVADWATNISAGPGESGQSLTFTVVAADPTLFAVQPKVDPSGKLTFTPALNAAGTTLVTVRLVDSGTTENGGVNTSAELTFSITIDKLHAAHNAVMPQDTNGDESITANDALRCINFLNAFSTRPVAEAPLAEGEFLDVNADGYITAADPLAIINHINAYGATIAPGSGGDGGEGEAAADLNTLLALLAADAAEIGVRKRR